jgi:hypothetical protein
VGPSCANRQPAWYMTRGAPDQTLCAGPLTAPAVLACAVQPPPVPLGVDARRRSSVSIETVDASSASTSIASFEEERAPDRSGTIKSGRSVSSRYAPPPATMAGAHFVSMLTLGVLLAWGRLSSFGCVGLSVAAMAWRRVADPRGRRGACARMQDDWRYV